MTYEQALHEAVAEYYADPLGFVLAMYPWGEGELEGFEGPDTWQARFLDRIGEAVRERGFDGRHPVLPIRAAVSSGHGVGKSAMVAWLADWIMSTRPECQGSVTANTATQLDTKTWPAIQLWTRRCRTGHWFEINAERMWRKGHKEGWFLARQASDDANFEAFQGQHAISSTSFYLFDEASKIGDKIAEAAEGGLTDGEPMIFLFGNATRPSGAFHRAVFGRERVRWITEVVDARESALANQAQIAQWIEDFGENSDFVRVKVRGLPPSVSDVQFISPDLVEAAQVRQVEVLDDEPLVAGVDLSRGGDDETVVWFRRGRDARSIPPVVVPGDKARDSMTVVSLLADILVQGRQGHTIAAMFLDATGGSIGGPIGDRLRQLGFRQVIDVGFGDAATDKRYANRRAQMWGDCRDWLAYGAIPKGRQLEMDLTGPGFGYRAKSDAIQLESKEDMKARGIASPNHGDALALTFAQKVSVRKPVQTFRPVYSSGPGRSGGWMGA